MKEQNKELDGDYLKSYEFVKEKMIEKGFKQLADTKAISFITKRFEYWISKNEETEPIIALIEVLKNNEAIVYMELDINELN